MRIAGGYSIVLFTVVFTVACENPQPVNNQQEQTIADTLLRHKSNCFLVNAKVEFYDLCNIDTIPFSVNRASNPYHCKCSIIGDSLLVQFDVNLNFASKYNGDACVEDSTLYLGFFDSNDPDNIQTGLGDCNFRFVYKVLNKNYKNVYSVLGEASTKRAVGIEFLKLVNQ